MPELEGTITTNTLDTIINPPAGTTVLPNAELEAIDTLPPGRHAFTLTPLTLYDDKTHIQKTTIEARSIFKLRQKGIVHSKENPTSVWHIRHNDETGYVRYTDLKGVDIFLLSNNYSQSPFISPLPAATA